MEADGAEALQKTVRHHVSRLDPEVDHSSLLRRHDSVSGV